MINVYVRVWEMNSQMFEQLKINNHQLINAGIQILSVEDIEILHIGNVSCKLLTLLLWYLPSKNGI